MLRVLISGHMGSNAQQANMPRKILLIQDDAQDAGKIRDALLNSNELSFEVEWVRRCCEALERLARRRRQAKHGATRIAAVLVDLFLPDSQGIGTFDQLFLAAPQVPILILSAWQDEKVAQLAVQHGAHDYLLKDRLEGYMLAKAVAHMLERAASAEALFAEKERARVTLSSIADAVIGTDVRSEVTHLNTVAERLTGWSREDAAGHPFEEVFRTIDATTREAARNPIALAIRDDKVIELTANCLLIRRDGAEIAIEDYAAPTHDRQGRVTGAVMAFHDVSTVACAIRAECGGAWVDYGDRALGATRSLPPNP
jgi:PAS domain S-box-containing protein